MANSRLRKNRRKSRITPVKEREGPTVEERRQMVKEKFYEKVRCKAAALLEQKALQAMQGPQRLTPQTNKRGENQDELQDKTPLPTINEDTEILPTKQNESMTTEHMVNEYTETMMDSNEVIGPGAHQGMATELDVTQADDKDEVLSQYTVPSPELDRFEEKALNETALVPEIKIKKPETGPAVDNTGKREENVPENKKDAPSLFQEVKDKGTSKPKKGSQSPTRQSNKASSDGEATEESTEMPNEEIEAMFEAVRQGELDLLDDMLDLPHADINAIWFGENLLMAAIRAQQEEMAYYLMENGIDINFKKQTFEVRKIAKQVKPPTPEVNSDEEKGKKKKKKKKLQEAETAPEPQTVVVQYEDPNPLTLGDIDCFTTSCRDMALEFELDDVVEMIDKHNKNLYPKIKLPPRQIRIKKPLVEKLKEANEWVESEDEEPPAEQEGTASKLKPVVRQQDGRALREIKPVLRDFPSHESSHDTATVLSAGTSQYSPRKSQITTARGKAHLMIPEPLQESDEHEATPPGRLAEEYVEHAPDSSILKLFSPVQANIVHHHEADDSQPKFPYKCSKAFLSRLASNESYRKSLEQFSIGGPKPPPVKSVGSFPWEKQNWEPQNPPKKPTNHMKGDKVEPVRYVCPWKQDTATSLLNLGQRAKTTTTLQPANTVKPVLRREQSDYLTYGKSKSQTSLLHSVVRTDSTVYSGRSSPRQRSPVRPQPRKVWTSELDFRDKPVRLTSLDKKGHDSLLSGPGGAANRSLKMMSRDSTRSLGSTRSLPKSSASTIRSSLTEQIEVLAEPSTANVQVLLVHDQNPKQSQKAVSFGYKNLWNRPQTDAARFTLQPSVRNSPRKKSRGSDDKRVRYSMEVQIIN